MPRIRGIAILDSPVLAASIPSPSAWYQSLSAVCTTTSGSATVTVPAATVLNLNLFQPVTGVGIPPNAYILTIASATTITLSIAATASGSPTLTFGLANPSQSPFGLLGPVWTGFPLPPLLAQNVTQGFGVSQFVDVNGCLLEVPNFQTIPVSTSYVIPPGEGMALIVTGATTGATYQVFQGSGVVAPSWVTILTVAAASSVLTPYMSDGSNFRITAGATTAPTVTFYQWR